MDLGPTWRGLAIPDHTTFSRRGGGLKVLPQRVERNGPLHVLVDSTGEKSYGEGEWFDQNHEAVKDLNHERMVVPLAKSRISA